MIGNGLYYAIKHHDDGKGIVAEVCRLNNGVVFVRPWEGEDCSNIHVYNMFISVHEFAKVLDFDNLVPVYEEDPEHKSEYRNYAKSEITGDSTEITCVEFVIENEIKNDIPMEGIAKTYFLAMKSTYDTDWMRVNKAIMEKFGHEGLEKVKEMAHAMGDTDEKYWEAAE